MRINLLTLTIISCIVILYQTSAVAQSKSAFKDTTSIHNLKKQLPAGYKITADGNYVYYNATNGHTSDKRANGEKTSAAQSGNVHNAALAPQAAADGNSGLHLQLTKDNNTWAQTGFYFMLSATDKYLASEDAVQIDGPDPAIFLSSYSSDGVNLCINTLSDYAYGKKIRLYVNSVTSGSYNLSLADINEIDTAAYNLYLIDNQQKDSIDLVHKACTFNIDRNDTSSFGAYRFVLSIQHKPITVAPYALSNFSGYKVLSGVELSWSAVNAGNYTGYTLQKVKSNSEDSLYFVQSDTLTGTYNFTDTHPVIGDNVYRLKQTGINGTVTYSATVTVGYSNSAPAGSLTLYPNPTKNMMNSNLKTVAVSPNVCVAYIYNSMGNLIKHEAVPGPTWSDDVSAYKTGIYFIQVKDSNGNIVAQSKFVKAE